MYDTAFCRLPVALQPITSFAPAATATAGRPGSPSKEAASLLLSMAGDLVGLEAIIASGRSMEDAAVREGDVVLLQANVDVHSGELAAVRVGAGPELLLRRLYFVDSRVWLRVEDGGQPPACLDRAQLRVVGRVVAVARRSPVEASGSVVDAA